MERTSEKIKKGLECCILETDDTSLVDHCRACPYKPTRLCFRTLLKDALALIEQLENHIRDLTKKVPKWMNDDGSILCPYCGTTMRMIPAWQKSIPDMGGYMWAARGKCPACGSITPEMHGRTAKEANAAAYAAAQWGHMPQLEEHIRDNPKKVEAQSGTDMNVPRWISVEERLPEKHGQMCVGLYNQYGAPRSILFPHVFTWHAYGDNGYVDGPHFSDEGLDGLKVWYWMPLPEAPKEGSRGRD